MIGGLTAPIFYAFPKTKFNMERKQHIWYESRFWVLLYAFITLLMMCLQFALGMIENYQITFRNIALNNFVNGLIELPMLVMSYGWTCLVALYCGSDRVVDIMKTTKLTMGNMSMGDLPKLRKIIIVSLILLLVAIGFNFLTDKDYQLSAFAAAFALGVISYVTGNKLVKAASYYHKDVDKNQDGIPDDAADSYLKWKRSQEKNNVEPQYLSWDYFLDDPANKEWEEKYRPSSVSTVVSEKKESCDRPHIDGFPRRRGLRNKAQEVVDNDEVALM